MQPSKHATKGIRQQVSTNVIEQVSMRDSHEAGERAGQQPNSQANSQARQRGENQTNQPPDDSQINVHGEAPTIRLRAQQHVSCCAVAQSHACDVHEWLNAYLRTWLPTCVLTPLVLPVADDLRSPLIDCVRESLRTWLLPSSLMCWCV